MMDLAWLDLPYDQRKKVVIKDAAGVVVGMMALLEPIGTPNGPLDELQRQLDEDMWGNPEWSPFVDHDRAKRAVERARMHGRLFVTWATPQEVLDFELQRVN